MKRYNRKKNIRWNTMKILADRAGHNHSANSIHIIWKSNFVDIDTDWRTWNHCLCNGILFSLTQTDYCQGAYGYPGDV